MKERKRTEISMKLKLDIKEVVMNHPTKYAAVAQKFKIDSSTVSKIYKNKGMLSDVHNLNNNRKRKRHSKAEDVDTALLK